MASKKRFVLLIIIVSSCYVSCLAGTFTVPEWLTDSCVFLMSGEKAKGTGFLLGVADSNSTFCYLITAKHVIKQLLSKQDKLAVRFNLKNSNKARTIKFPISTKYNGKRWFEHKNAAVDLAIVLLPIFSEINELDVKLRRIKDANDDLLATAHWLEKYKVGQGDRAFTLGLVPYLYTKDQENLVLSRFGRVSLLPTHDINLPGGKQKAYFIDCQAFPGNSGGPAFVLIERSEKGALLAGWRFGLLGVVTEFVPSPLRMKKVKLKDSQSKEAIMPIENTGISKVVPVDYLVDILFSNEHKRFRESLIDLKRLVQSKEESKKAD